MKPQFLNICSNALQDAYLYAHIILEAYISLDLIVGMKATYNFTDHAQLVVGAKFNVCKAIYLVFSYKLFYS